MMDLQFPGLNVNLFDVLDINIPALVIFILGGVAVALMLWHIVKRRHKRSVAVKYSDIRIVQRAASSTRHRMRFIVPALRILAVVLFTVALARPRSGTEVREVTSEG
ncbi:MAG: hypothetical protein GY867_00555, partial [bacterium]|nr:hypothetical protein [bacterium]